MTNATPVVDQALLDRVRAELAASGQPATPARVAATLRSVGAVLGDARVLEITELLRAEISGAGPLDGLLREAGVTDVLVNGPEEIWVDRGHGLERTATRFRDESAVRALAQRLATAAGRRLDDAVPYVDARLAGGVRLHAVLPPIAPDGTVVSLRVPSNRAFTLNDLVESASIPAELVSWIQAIIAYRLAFLITGGTGSGKTTVLGALLSTVDPGDRIVLVEDSSELQPQHAHVVRLEARTANVEGIGRVELADLVRQALRMRPDRLVVGEVRGPEVADLLSALNTGHEGGCGTLHANSADDVPARLEALGVAAGMSRDAVHAQAVSALHVVLHLVRETNGQRRLAQIHVTRRSSAGYLETRPAFTIGADGSVAPAEGHDHLATLLTARGWAGPAC